MVQYLGPIFVPNLFCFLHDWNACYFAFCTIGMPVILQWHDNVFCPSFCTQKLLRKPLFLGMLALSFEVVGSGGQQKHATHHFTLKFRGAKL
ncbi:MAG: hypothetical protein DRR16_09655 [Candidatus Parabeggiatoa sp. nov. 3]|nr:MAG: hypothetical protein DRQ99_11600 [Gammaproteobacteria bacterium]RKZ86439.1 MAG: hypothetical protein DRR16_09655 [Gammaproteobacteria bacterium]